MRVLIVVGILLTVLTREAGACRAQPDGPLAGPKVKAESRTLSIVSYDLDGKVRRAELSPEEAVARRLELEPSTRAKVDALFAQRARTLETFIEENLSLVVRLVGAEGASAGEKWALALEVFERTRAVREGGPLDQRVSALLEEGDRAIFDRMLREYWKAIASEDAKSLKPKGRLGAVLEEKFKSLGREAEAAYKRCEKSGAILYHYLFDSMTLTPEQRRQLRALCSQYSMNGIDNNDKKAQGAMFVAVMQVLSPEQGRELAERLGGKPASRQKGKPAARVK